MNKFGRKSKPKPKTIKINFSWDDSSVNTSRTNTSEGEIETDWLYDSWEFNFLTKRGKKEKVSAESENLLVIHEQKQKQDSPFPQLDNSSAPIITLRSTETLTLPRKIRHAAGADKYTIKTPKIHIRNQYDYDDDITLGDIYYKPKKSKKNPNPVFTKM